MRTQAERVGKRIKDLREAKGWTQVLLAFKVDTYQPWLSRIEAGQVMPTTSQSMRLARVFRITLDELLEGK